VSYGNQQTNMGTHLGYSRTATSEDKGMKQYLQLVVAVPLALAFLWLATFNLESAPPIWWDEGWTMSVARNWIERGFYGRLLEGEPAQPGPEAHLTVTALIALSFRLFGVGIWQARTVGLIFTLAALVVMYFLAKRLYSKRVAVATLAVLLFMSPRPAFHPLLMGRQVMGEMPMIFYLLSGYFLLLLSLQKSKWLILAAIPLWALALDTKLQPIPFWFLSLFLPLSLFIYYKLWSMAWVFLAVLAGSSLGAMALNYWGHTILTDPRLPSTVISGLYGVSVFVLLPLERRIEILTGLVWVLPTLLGLCYAAGDFIGKEKLLATLTPPNVVRLALWILVVSWFGWFIVLSVGYERHLFPAVFIGSVFGAVLLKDLTGNFSLKSTIALGAGALKTLRPRWQNCGALLAIVLITYLGTANGKTLYRVLYSESDESVKQVAAFLNTQTPSNVLIEIFDTELYFLLNRRYHYPPDHVNIELTRQIFLWQDVPIHYDPLAANPDYLVVGPHSKMLHLYDYVLTTGAFRPLRIFGRYRVYERIR
jgi:Dolichyl-phosphate-mannose-protein mannosyltransferase